MIAAAQGLTDRIQNHKWPFRNQIRDISMNCLETREVSADLDIGRNWKSLNIFGRDVLENDYGEDQNGDGN
jgi:hypothetical protein